MTSPLAPAAARAADAERATARLGIAIVVAVVAVDQFTKVLAERLLVPRHIPHDVVGDLLRFTLTYNPGAAFGMHLGDSSRWIFMLLTVMIVGFLLRLYRSLPIGERALKLAIAAVIGGAIGNFVDRVRSVEGVVDFIDVGVGDVRFWTFNVADMAVSIGAVCLVLLLWRYESRLQHAEHVGEAAADRSA
jgi:signal peptidase II